MGTIEKDDQLSRDEGAASRDGEEEEKSERRIVAYLEQCEEYSVL